MKAINDDERAFFEFLGAHEDFLEKLKNGDLPRKQSETTIYIRGKV